MARDTDKRASSFETENTGGLLSGFLAEEDVLDRRGLWRLGSWGVASVGAVVLAVFANQSSTTARREQGDLARQAEQIQLVAKQGQSEARRLASAIETLNGDRDRLYSRVTVLEQGLETVTGAIAKQQAATPASLSSVSPPAPTPPSSTAAAAANDPQPPAQKQPPAQSPAPAPAVSRWRRRRQSPQINRWRSRPRLLPPPRSPLLPRSRPLPRSHQIRRRPQPRQQPQPRWQPLPPWPP